MNTPQTRYDSLTARAITDLRQWYPSYRDLRDSVPDAGFDRAFVMDAFVEYGLATSLADEIEKQELVDHQHFAFRLTPKGIEVEDNGGYLRWIEFQRQLRKSDESQRIQGAQLTKFQVQVFTPTFIMATIGFAFAAIEIAILIAQWLAQ